MKTRTISRTLLLALLTLICLPLRGFADEASPTIQSTVLKLYASLNDEQKKSATLPLDSPERNKQVFPGGPRPGIQIHTLNPDQQKLAMDLLTAFTSDYGKQKAIAITEQKPDNPSNDVGFGRYYVCFFGEPGEGKTYAWRIAEHHLTLVHVEVEKGEPKTFGPILLGANPPTLWDDEEDKMIALYGAMTPDERAKFTQTGKGISSEPLKNAPVHVGDLSPSAKEAAKAVLDNRLSFYSDPIRKQVQAIIDSQGGIDAMEIAFYGQATKRCRDGGKWDFKLGGKSFLCDYENTRGHIHLSMKGQLADSAAK